MICPSGRAIRKSRSSCNWLFFSSDLQSPEPDQRRQICNIGRPGVSRVSSAGLPAVFVLRPGKAHVGWIFILAIATWFVFSDPKNDVADLLVLLLGVHNVRNAPQTDFLAAEGSPLCREPWPAAARVAHPEPSQRTCSLPITSQP